MICVIDVVEAPKTPHRSNYSCLGFDDDDDDDDEKKRKREKREKKRERRPFFLLFCPPQGKVGKHTSAAHARAAGYKKTSQKNNQTHSSRTY